MFRHAKFRQKGKKERESFCNFLILPIGCRSGIFLPTSAVRERNPGRRESGCRCHELALANVSDNLNYLCLFEMAWMSSFVQLHGQVDESISYYRECDRIDRLYEFSINHLFKPCHITSLLSYSTCVYLSCTTYYSNSKSFNRLFVIRETCWNDSHEPFYDSFRGVY